MATIFVVTTAFALLFAGISALQLPPYLNLIVAAYIAIVGVSQAFLFRGLRPRTSSLLVGIATYWTFTVGYFYLLNSRIYPTSMLGTMLASGLMTGAVLGYVAGALVGGVFLIANFLRNRLSRFRKTPAEITLPDESPLSGG